MGSVDLEQVRELIDGEWTAPYPARLPSGQIVQVPRLRKTYVSWSGDPGPFMDPPVPGKDLYDHEGVPNWREFIILRRLERGGWNGVWVKNFGGRGRVLWRDLLQASELPPAAARTLAAVDAQLDGHGWLTSKGGGVWDVLVARGNDVLCVEDKTKRVRDLNLNQLQFLQAAGELDEPPTFLVVEAR